MMTRNAACISPPLQTHIDIPVTIFHGKTEMLTIWDEMIDTGIGSGISPALWQYRLSPTIESGVYDTFQIDTWRDIIISSIPYAWRLCKQYQMQYPDAFSVDIPLRLSILGYPIQIEGQYRYCIWGIHDRRAYAGDLLHAALSIAILKEYYGRILDLSSTDIETVMGICEEVAPYIQCMTESLPIQTQYERQRRQPHHEIMQALTHYMYDTVESTWIMEHQEDVPVVYMGPRLQTFRVYDRVEQAYHLTKK